MGHGGEAIHPPPDRIELATTAVLQDVEARPELDVQSAGVDLRSVRQGLLEEGLLLGYPILAGIRQLVVVAVVPDVGPDHRLKSQEALPEPLRQTSGGVSVVLCHVRPLLLCSSIAGAYPTTATPREPADRR